VNEVELLGRKLVPRVERGPCDTLAHLLSSGG
jgi:hypothetical protein